MKIKGFPAKLKKLLKFYDQNGGVIDFVILECEPGDDPSYAIYEHAVQLALQAIGQRTYRSIIRYVSH